MAIPYIGAHIGFAAAFLNPFTVGIAQGLSDLPLFSGIGFRFVIWLLFTGSAITYVILYTKKIKQPELSPQPNSNNDDNPNNLTNNAEMPSMRRRHQLVLVVFSAGMMLLISASCNTSGTSKKSLRSFSDWELLLQ